VAIEQDLTNLGGKECVKTHQCSQMNWNLAARLALSKASPRSVDSMVKSVTTKARDAISDAAQRGAQGVKSVAGDALGAAAIAAAEVVFESTANALGAGRTKIKQSSPAMKRAIGKAAKQTISRPRREKAVTKRRKPASSKQKKRGGRRAHSAARR
jgi:hypothetical protein